MNTNVRTKKMSETTKNVFYLAASLTLLIAADTIAPLLDKL